MPFIKVETITCSETNETVDLSCVTVIHTIKDSEQEIKKENKDPLQQEVKNDNVQPTSRKVAKKKSTAYDSDIPMKMLNCDKCNFFTSTTRKMSHHQLSQHNFTLISCDKCDFKTKSKRALDHHILVKHEREDAVLLTCDKCIYATPSKITLKRHMRKHETDEKEGRWIYCANCDYKAKGKRNLALHMKVHTPVEQRDMFLCTECPFGTLTQCLFRRHMLEHKGVRQTFQCHDCGYQNSMKSKLRKHIQVKHLDRSLLPLLKCKQCDYQTRLATNLYQHSLSHKPFEECSTVFYCHDCDYKAKIKHHLVQHITSRHLNQRREKQKKTEKAKNVRK